MDPRNIAVIGAGVAGLACAHRLQHAGHKPVVLDKGRAPGGRVCTRVTADGSWDHGAQFIRARDPGFETRLGRLHGGKALARWDAAFFSADAPWVGTPSMRSLGAAMSAGVDVRCGYTVTSLEHDKGTVRLFGKRRGQSESASLGEFEDVVLAMPAPQVPALAPELAPLLEGIAYDPCWAFLCRYDSPLDVPDVIESMGQVVAFAQRESSKPRRKPGERWVLHASSEFSREHLELTQDQVVSELLSRLQGTPLTAQPMTDCVAHRWRYARVAQALGMPFVRSGRLSVCGDGLLGPRVEAAWLSGDALGAALA